MYEDPMEHEQRPNGVSRRRILKAGAATMGVVGLGVGTGSASHYELGLVERENHRRGVPLEVVGIPVEPSKRFSCNPNEPLEPADCFDIRYEDEAEARSLAFEARDGVVEVGDHLVFGPTTCLTRDQPDGRPWRLTPFHRL